MDSVKAWMIPVVLFAVIICLGVMMIFARPSTFFETPDGLTIITSQSALSNGGMRQLGQMWTQYPNYFAIGAAVAAFGILGMGYSITSMYREWDRTHEDG